MEDVFGDDDGAEGGVYGESGADTSDTASEHKDICEQMWDSFGMKGNESPALAGNSHQSVRHFSVPLCESVSVVYGEGVAGGLKESAQGQEVIEAAFCGESGGGEGCCGGADVVDEHGGEFGCGEVSDGGGCEDAIGEPCAAAADEWLECFAAAAEAREFCVEGVSLFAEVVGNLPDLSICEPFGEGVDL